MKFIIKIINKIKQLDESINVISYDDQHIHLIDKYNYKYVLTKDTCRKYIINNTIENMKPIIKTNPYYIDNIINYIALNKIPVIFKSVDDKNIEFICECGNIVNRNKDKFFNSKRYKCDDCTNNSRKNIMSHNQEYVTEKLKLMGYTTEDLYKNAKTKITIVDNDGYMYYSTFGNICNNNKLDKWNKYNKYSIYNIKRYIETNNIDCELLSKQYVDYYNFLKWKCSCGDIFEASLNHFIYSNQTRCEVCSKKISKLELLTMKWLEENNIVYEKQKTYDDLLYKKKLRYDFYIPNLDMLIEVDGRQHFEYCENGIYTKEKYDFQKFIDNVKNEYTVSNNIKLLRIGYKKFNSKEEYKNILKSEIIG